MFILNLTSQRHINSKLILRNIAKIFNFPYFKIIFNLFDKRTIKIEQAVKVVILKTKCLQN